MSPSLRNPPGADQLGPRRARAPSGKPAGLAEPPKGDGSASAVAAARDAQPVKAGGVRVEEALRVLQGDTPVYGAGGHRLRTSGPVRRL